MNLAATCRSTSQKPKLQIAVLLLIILTGITPLIAATCPASTTLDQLGSCTLGPANIITFSNFQSTLPGNTIVSVSLNSGTNPGSVGFTFSPQGGSLVSYTFSYTATCSAACLITGGSDSASELPAGGSIYNFTMGAANSGNISGNFNTTFAGVTGVSNSGTYVSGGVNQSMTLDINYAPAPSGTPEPTSLLLFGSGFLAVGVAARKGLKRV